MKAISLWQPWATLIAIGAKRIETRSWYTPHRGPLAIHAAKTWNAQLDRLRLSEPFWPALRDGGWERFNELPRGCIVAVCDLIDCRRIHNGRLWSGDGWGNTFSDPIPPSPERDFGDYTGGRYAWLLTNVRALRQPLPWRGAQSLFDVPDEAIHAAALAGSGMQK